VAVAGGIMIGASAEEPPLAQANRNIDKKSKLRMLLNPEFTVRKLSGDSEAKLALN
jgi:hypothetical protein